jgi:hypothetical protein
MSKPIISKSNNANQQSYIQVGFQDSSQFDELIKDHGYNAYIDKALKCPCSDRNTGLSQTGCLNCGGCGWFFVDRQETYTLALGMNSSKKIENWSETNMGKSSISTSYDKNLSFMDRFTLNDELEECYNQILKPFNANGKNFAFAIYNPLEVLYCYCFDGLDKELKHLVQGIDFNIENNLIIFKEDYQTRIQQGNFSVSIRYTHKPVYHIIDIKREFTKSKFIENDSTTKARLPKSFMCIKAHMILDSENLTKNRLIENTKQ